ncbi:MAG: hypothetical protein V3W31_08910 [Thermodesulfobacteriota bacterium]
MSDIRPKNKRLAIIGSDKECPYWKESGWKESVDAYRGHFITDYGRWRGVIHKSFFGNYAFYIFDPPEALRNSDHWPCFTNKGKGKYSIHFSKKPDDISSGIMIVEQLISESFNKERSRGNEAIGFYTA